MRRPAALIGSLVANEAIAHITGLSPVACLAAPALIDSTLAVTHEDRPARARLPDLRVRRRLVPCVRAA